MPAAPIKVMWLAGWTATTSGGAPATTATRRLIESQTAVIRMTDARM